jgi:starch synthase (maltosyl-transferring)
VKKARAMELEFAMDIAFQCSPDHPYVKAHPEWFKKRPDGTIQYAENPPKKYQDIYPFDFEGPAWKSLWQELLSVVEFWVEQGVKVFRVDNPHTKPFHFWEWLIAQVRSKNPEVIFLAEAFTRPKVMAYLAKSGFSQSYTYFTWRNVKWELTQYMNELTQTELKDYFGANFWPNTPDILHERLQENNSTVYKQRLVLAATLMSNYGIYGPAFELMEYQPRDHGSEEYLNSEKYQLRTWDLKASHSLAPFLKKINQIRNTHPSLQQNRNFRFHPIDNESLLAYSKTLGSEKIITVVNLDPHKVQSGLLELPLIDWSISDNEYFEMEDLLTGATYTWQGWRNFVELRPDQPAHIFKIHIKPRPTTPAGAKA